MLSVEPIAVLCRDVTKQFRNGEVVTPVLRGVDFSAPSGELSMLVGPSGCGKTTLISIIAGILTPTSGDVRLFGQSLAGLSARQLVEFRRRNVGFIFQQYNLLPALTATENAAVPLIAAGSGASEAHRRAAEMLERLGLGAHRDKLPAQLSGGQQQRVAIARALVHGPRLVVCDEPTAALDSQSGQAAMRLLRETAVQPGRAVIVVTHDNRIFDLADRIVHMGDGVVTHVETQAPAA